MKLSVLEIRLGERKIGHLFKYGDIIRLAVEPDYANDRERPMLSLSFQAADPAQTPALLLDPFSSILNSPGNGRLPAFFQNLLPEGILRKHIAMERKCDEDDHFELLAACGGDLPGKVYATPAPSDKSLTARLVTQNNDSVEMTVIDDPLDDGISLSGMQPKIALVKEGGRFVAARHLDSGHIIGKLPAAQYDLLPQVELLSLQLADAAGVTVCKATLEPLTLIDNKGELALGRSTHFLAVQRFDRDCPGRMHAEDFAQVLSVDPQNKYSGGTYADIAAMMLAVTGLGESAVLELTRRIAVSELLGNYDFHLKNIGILHHDDGRIELSPAYDIVAYCVYVRGSGHALRFTPEQKSREGLTPQQLRAFANDIGLPEPKLRKEVSKVCQLALERWPALIERSDLLDGQKAKLLEHLYSRPMVQTLMRRQAVKSNASAGSES
ncbi:type II toxin-antitoxin system HipA family toxin [Pseudoduganella violacea]|uniref:Serine/threonine-protein kinase HipA n=1 Tax=Pseudoduganella violacea TaxID=1715466 RepID=A0A7W5BFM4_9BURK|nr:type II toxin-antitoxin system HipA family toxin [Pseudoduganella violacea]MBB3122281.1 serine/threonine-protein kinase HipA [Pseudoduganella violacea]